MKHHHKHYVLTEDFGEIMGQWAKEKDFVLPSEQWFEKNHQQLRNHIEKLISKKEVAVVDSIQYDFISDGLRKLSHNFYDESGELVPIEHFISLDRVYTSKMKNQFCGGDIFSFLDISRAVDENEKEIGYMPRGYADLIVNQVSNIASKMNGGRRVLLIDDGMWSGKSISVAIDMLKEYCVNVVGVVIGLKIKSSIMLDNVQSIISYGELNPVVDWICERDFFPGCPFGGRSVYGYPNCGMYYAGNKNRLLNWASIDDDRVLQEFCNRKSKELFKLIGELSGRDVMISDLPRIPYEMRNRTGIFYQELEGVYV